MQFRNFIGSKVFVVRIGFWGYNENEGMESLECRKFLLEGVVAVATINIELPDEMIQFVMPENKEDQLIRNAMMLYPYVLRKKISHGRAAEILGIHKLDLIDLYGQMGFCYFDQTKEELDKELQTFKELKLDEVVS